MMIVITKIIDNCHKKKSCVFQSSIAIQYYIEPLRVSIMGKAGYIDSDPTLVGGPCIGYIPFS